MIKKCRFCNSSNLRIIKKKENFVLLECLKCRIIFLDPFPDKSKSRNSYMSNSFGYSEYYELTEPLDKISFNRGIDFLKRHLSDKKYKMLDYGCSTGNFMEVARERGFIIQGRELNKKSISICKKKGFIVNSRDKNFDIVNANDIIEHMTNPLDFIREVHGLLNQNGLFVVSTPDFDNFFVRMTQIKPKEHLYYFKKDVLKKSLEDNGFKVLYSGQFNRKRSVNALLYSPTSDNKMIKKLLRMVCFFRMNWFFDFWLGHLGDSILIIAMKKTSKNKRR